MFGKKENVNANRYIVMSKLDGQTTFYAQKGFATRDDADAYAKLMMKTEEYDRNKYYLFEQSVAYSLGDNLILHLSLISAVSIFGSSKGGLHREKYSKLSLAARLGRVLWPVRLDVGMRSMKTSLSLYLSLSTLKCENLAHAYIYIYIYINPILM